MIQVPPIPEELIKYLEKIFPDTAGTVKDSLDSIRFRQGQVSVVQHLRVQFDQQNP